MIQHAQLSDADRRTSRQYEEAGVFSEVQGHLLDLTAGMNLVHCPDGEQFLEIADVLRRLCRVQSKRVRLQPFGLLGGALLIAPDSPLSSKFGEDRILLDHLRRGANGRQITTTVALAHAPCLAAEAHRLSMEEAAELLIKAEQRIRRENPGMQVASIFQVDYGQGKKELHHVSGKHWEAWRARSS